MWRSVLIGEIGREWGSRDPAAANLRQENGKWVPGLAAFEDWYRRDAAAARAWLDADGFPAEAQEARAALRKHGLTLRAIEDFPGACAALGDLYSEAQRGAVGLESSLRARCIPARWTVGLAGIPEG